MSLHLELQGCVAEGRQVASAASRRHLFIRQNPCLSCLASWKVDVVDSLSLASTWRLVLTEWEELPVACSRHGGVSSACRKTTLCCNTSLARRFPVMVCWLTEIVKIIMTINAVSDHNYIWLVAFFSASLRRCCVVLSLSAMIQQEIMKKKRRKKGELE